MMTPAATPERNQGIGWGIGEEEKGERSSHSKRKGGGRRGRVVRRPLLLTPFGEDPPSRVIF